MRSPTVSLFFLYLYDSLLGVVSPHPSSGRSSPLTSPICLPRDMKILKRPPPLVPLFLSPSHSLLLPLSPETSKIMHGVVTKDQIVVHSYSVLSQPSHLPCHPSPSFSLHSLISLSASLPLRCLLWNHRPSSGLRDFLLSVRFIE
jgi:hypothetical protein